MPDPNIRRDKALEDIARSLKSIDRNLERLVKNSSREPSTTHPYLGTSEIDATDSSGEEGTGPYGTGTSHPYG